MREIFIKELKDSGKKDNYRDGKILANMAEVSTEGINSREVVLN